MSPWCTQRILFPLSHLWPRQSPCLPPSLPKTRSQTPSLRTSHGVLEESCTRARIDTHTPYGYGRVYMGYDV